MASSSSNIVLNSNNVYIYDRSRGWIPGRLLSSTETHASVSISSWDDFHPDDDEEEEDRRPSRDKLIEVCLEDYPNNSLPLQNVDEKGSLREVSDMVDLPFLHEAAILYNLRERHVKRLPYTRTGDIVIAVNPYQWLDGLYSEDQREEYADKLIWNAPKGEDPKSGVSPHVYETSALAYRGLAIHSTNQSILVSGESGAGKTETVKILMSHLASVQQTHNLSEASLQIVNRVLDSNPLLEAFGNAKTFRNDNSSRFGKYVQLQFDAEDPVLAAYSGKTVPSCVLAGSRSATYLLEKSRVVSHESHERNYHIFYQLLRAPPDVKEDLWAGLRNTHFDSFKYVGDTDTHEIEGMSDRDRWDMTVNSLNILGVEGDQFKSLMRALCIVLQLGNITFAPDPEYEENGKITSLEELQALAELMGVETEYLTHSLTLRTVKARHETYKVPLNTTQAKDSCDAFAKEIYSQVFDWLVKTINHATCAEHNYEHRKECKKFGIIGLLDIFGFESFVVNRFEQLCINYANEKLQQKFTMDIFRSVQEEYEFEGIQLGDVTFIDNADVLNLIEGRMGLIAVLNEECVRPRGNDVSFVSKINTMNKDSEYLIQDNFYREFEFGVKHYAGPVTYDSTNFVSKNKDTLPSDLLNCAISSQNSLIHNEFSNYSNETHHKKTNVRRGTGSLVRPTLWTKFRQQLGTLMHNISETKTRYIRCIKPNTQKQPLIMQQHMTIEQLRCAGVVAAITISRSSFPNRLEHEITLERFGCLLGQSFTPSKEEKKESDEERTHFLQREINRVLGILFKPMKKTVEPFVCGKTRVYFRAGALEYLEARRLLALGDRAMHLQRIVRGFLSRVKFRTLRLISIRLQANARRSVQRKRFQKVRIGCIILQTWRRQCIAKHELTDLRRHYKATVIQTHWRMVRAIVYRWNCIRATIRIQAIARGAIQRPIFRQELKEWKEASLLENQVKMLQKKLEEAEQKRIEAEKKAEEGVVKTKTVVIQKDAEEKKNEGLTAQQQTLMDESGKMLEYLRKEVFKLRSQNSQLRTDFDLLKENNQRLMDANASAGASFAALNQHAKQLSRTNAKLMGELQKNKQQLSKFNLSQIELREELKMKQATYIAEVHSRLQYQKTMHRIVDAIQSRCRDERLVEDIITMSDDCESDYMSGPSGINVSSSRPQATAAASTPKPRNLFSKLAGEHETPHGESRLGQTPEDQSLSSRFLSFFGGGASGGSGRHEGSISEDTQSSPMTAVKKPGLTTLQAFSGGFSEV